MRNILKLLIDSFVRTWAGRIDHVFYTAFTVLVFVMGFRWISDVPITWFDVVQALLGIGLVIAIALAIKLRKNVK